MDLSFHVANARGAWLRRAGFADFLRRMAWLYAAKVSARLVAREWTIGFRYPQPVGCVRLQLRCNGGADAFIHSEVFERQYYRLPLARAPETILDLGANIALSTIFLARLYPNSRIACVEPVAENLRLLRRNLELNGVTADVIAAAVGPTDGIVTMQRSARDYAHHVADEASPPGSLFEVAGISMPTILRRLGWSRVGLLKMDIEGHERRLFAPACDCDWLRQVDTLCLEYHHHFAEEELSRLAERFGFAAPRRLRGQIWFLTRQDCAAEPARARC